MRMVDDDCRAKCCVVDPRGMCLPGMSGHDLIKSTAAAGCRRVRLVEHVAQRPATWLEGLACRPREDAGERCLPHNERIASKIIAIKFDQVEGIQERAVSERCLPDNERRS